MIWYNMGTIKDFLITLLVLSCIVAVTQLALLVVILIKVLI